MYRMKFSIIRDGYSDFLVLKSFISSIIYAEQNVKLNDDDFTDLEDLKIGESIKRYLDKKNNNGEDNEEDKEAKKLENTLVTVLTVALKDKGLTNKDILILNADTEYILTKKEDFHKDWVRKLYCVIHSAINEVYRIMVEQGLNFKNLPIIIPLILFPSIEILVAACYLSENQKNDMRKLKAKPDLKNKVWGTDRIGSAIESGKMQEILELCFSNGSDSFNDIYKDIPEVRHLIHILSYPREIA